MKCQNETVSTTVRMCFHISLFVYKTQYLKKKVMESSETNNTDNLAKIQKKIEKDRRKRQSLAATQQNPRGEKKQR